MSIITSTAAKQVGKAFALKTDQDLQMFDDLWEVYQVGHHFEKTHEKAQHDAVDKSFSAIINIAAKQSGQDAPGFGRSVMSTTATRENPNACGFGEPDGREGAFRVSTKCLILSRVLAEEGVFGTYQHQSPGACQPHRMGKRHSLRPICDSTRTTSAKTDP
jgi:hypothetical protein